MGSRGIFGWSSPPQPLTPVTEGSEPPESPSPYGDFYVDPDVPVVEDEEEEEFEEIEQPPPTVPFTKLFTHADWFDWVLMVVGSVAAAVHGTALVVYLHFFGKIINLLSRSDSMDDDQLFHEFKQVRRFFSFILCIETIV